MNIEATFPALAVIDGKYVHPFQKTMRVDLASFDQVESGFFEQLTIYDATVRWRINKVTKLSSKSYLFFLSVIPQKFYDGNVFWYLSHKDPNEYTFKDKILASIEKFIPSYTAFIRINIDWHKPEVYNFHELKEILMKTYETYGNDPDHISARGYNTLESYMKIIRESQTFGELYRGLVERMYPQVFRNQ